MLFVADLHRHLVKSQVTSLFFLDTGFLYMWVLDVSSVFKTLRSARFGKSSARTDEGEKMEEWAGGVSGFHGGFLRGFLRSPRYSSHWFLKIPKKFKIFKSLEQKTRKPLWLWDPQSFLGHLQISGNRDDGDMASDEKFGWVIEATEPAADEKWGFHQQWEFKQSTLARQHHSWEIYPLVN